MIDHFTLSVSDLPATRTFYESVLKPLGYSVMRDYGVIFGMGDGSKPYLWIKNGTPVTTPQHIAFMAATRGAVDAFHAAALAAGATDDGSPGLREHYHPSYYGAFVIDPVNGHPIEAVCHVLAGSVASGAAKKAKAAAAKKKPVKKAAPKKAAAKKKAKSKR